MKVKIVLFILLSLGACRPGSVELEQVLAQSKYSVLMFLAPDCPLCLTFTKPFNELSEQHQDVQFIGVLSGEAYSEQEIREFRERAGFDKAIVRDPGLTIARRLEARVTPEFFLLDQSGKVLYRGLLDDRMERLGVYRQRWDNFYLRNALQSVGAGEAVAIPQTDAVGCILEY